jgi:hypothetical protein
MLCVSWRGIEFFMEGLVSESFERMTYNEGENTRAKPKSAEVNSS